MVVDNLNTQGFMIRPDNANPPLIVNADTVLSVPVTAQRLQTIAGRHT